MDIIRQAEIGYGATYMTPYGVRQIMYADWAASGRKLRFIEDALTSIFLPSYGNLHSRDSHCSLQSSATVAETRGLIRDLIKATHEHSVIFCGSGSTAAITKFIRIILASLKPPEPLVSFDVSHFEDTRWGSIKCKLCRVLLENEKNAREHAASRGHRELSDALIDTGAQQRRPVFLLDPSAHHSVLLPAIQASGGAFAVLRPDPIHGMASEDDLVHKLQIIKSCNASLEVRLTPVMIISAGSNVTGVVRDISKLATLVKGCGGFVLADAAGVFGHESIDFSTMSVDAVAISPHKLPGGPGTPGVLVMRKELLRFAEPTEPGGGTVNYVSLASATFLYDLESREEPGTLDISGVIRLGLVIRSLQQRPGYGVGAELIARTVNNLRGSKRLIFLGPTKLPEDCHAGSVVTFMVRYGNGGDKEVGLFLHGNFISTILSDFWGVQARSGCFCSGPQVAQLLGVGAELEGRYAAAVDAGHTMLRFSATRVSLSNINDTDDQERLEMALRWTAENAWLLLPFYRLVPGTGQFESRLLPKREQCLSFLRDLNLTQGIGGEAALLPIEVAASRGPSQSAKSATLNRVKRNSPSVKANKKTADELQNLLKGTGGLRSVLRKAGGGTGRKPPPVKEEPVNELQAILLRRRAGRPTTDSGNSHSSCQQEGNTQSERCVEEPQVRSGEVCVEEPQVRSGEVCVEEPQVRSGEVCVEEPQVRSGEVCVEEAQVRSGEDEKPLAAAEDVEVEPPCAVKQTFLPKTAALDDDPHVESKEVEVQVMIRGERSPAKSSSLSEHFDMIRGRMIVPEDVESLLEENDQAVEALYNITPRKIFETFGATPVRFLPSWYGDLMWFPLAADVIYSISQVKNFRDARPLVVPNTPRSFWLDESDIERKGSAPFDPRRSGDHGTFELSDGLFIERLRAAAEVAEDRSLTIGGMIAPTTKSVIEMTPVDENSETLIYIPRSGSDPTPSPDAESELSEENPGWGDLLDIEIVSSESGTQKEMAVGLMPDLKRNVARAIKDFDMIRQGDRVLVGLSGGKDSMTLLHCLLSLQKSLKDKFEIAVATVDPKAAEFDPSPLTAYVESLGLKHHMLSLPIVEIAKERMNKKVSFCSFCARMKRGLLYGCMKENEYTALALGQHLDDICESFLMSVFYTGSLNTMKAHYVTNDGLRVIRPLLFVRESVLTQQANDSKLPIITENCPACFSVPKERHRMKILLSNEEYHRNGVINSMTTALMPLISKGCVAPRGEEHEEEQEMTACKVGKDCDLQQN